MIDLLIIIDNPYREYLNLKLLDGCIEKKKLNSRIVSKHLFEDAIIKYKPQSVIIPRITAGFKKIFHLSNKYRFNIYLLPCEHGGGDEVRIKSFLVGYENKDNYILENFKHYKEIKKIFVPSEVYKKVCIESGLFFENQILVTGTISSDFWFEEISECLNKKKNKYSIGIATSFKSTFFGINFNTFLDGLLFIKNISDEKKFSKAIENNILFQSFEALSFLNLLKIIEKNPEINFSWRPHPQENLKGAKQFVKKIKNLEINRDIIPYNWIKDQSLILLNSSTMIYDSFFLKTPSISLVNLISDNIKNNLEDTKKPLETGQIHNPNSIDEVLEIIQNKNYSKTIKTDKDKMLKVSINNFHFPRKNFAVTSIAEEISKNTNTATKKKISKLVLNIYADILINLKMIKAAYSIKYKDISLDKVLNPLNIEDRLKTNHFINQIIKKIT